MRRAGLLLALALAPACVSFNWERESRYAPIPAASIGRLEAQASDLSGCLQAFGAPLWVWEHPGGEQGGAVLAYGWFEERDLGVRVSVPLSEHTSASFDYDDIDARMRGLVLFFDEHWTLVSWQTGLLRDLVDEARRRPAFVEDEA